MALRPPLPAYDAPAFVVLDTNVLLDLLVFADVDAQGLAAALSSGRLSALATSAMFDELADVLSRPFLASWPVEAAEVMLRARTLCHEVVAPPPAPAPTPRCADADDQKFVDLAWAWPTRWLFSRDRAVLALARPAMTRGLGIVTPGSWAAAGTARNAGTDTPK